jgi:hypothetical protein
MKKKEIHLFLTLLLVLVTGCSSVQMRKIFFGTSLHDFDIAQKKYTKIVAMKPQDCFNRVYDILVKKPVIVSKKNQKNKFLVAYGFKDFFKSTMSKAAGLNTTEVGIRFKETTDGKTEMIIISDNSRLAEFVSADLAKQLEAK